MGNNINYFQFCQNVCFNLSINHVLLVNIAAYLGQGIILEKVFLISVRLSFLITFYILLLNAPNSLKITIIRNYRRHFNLSFLRK